MLVNSGDIYIWDSLPEHKEEHGENQPEILL